MLENIVEFVSSNIILIAIALVYFGIRIMKYMDTGFGKNDLSSKTDQYLINLALIFLMFSFVRSYDLHKQKKQLKLSTHFLKTTVKIFLNAEIKIKN